jgi:hypothetical protein
MRRTPGFEIGGPGSKGSPDACARRCRTVDPGGPAGSSRSIVPSSAATRAASATTGFVTEAQPYARAESPRRPSSPSVESAATETLSAGQASVD